MTLLRAIVEGGLCAVLTVGVLTWIYNRLLAPLRESWAKKIMSLGILPVGVFAGMGHGVAVAKGWPTTAIPVLLGGWLFARCLLLWRRERQRNRNVRRARVEVGEAIDYQRMPWLVRPIFKAIAPFNDVGRLEVVRVERTSRTARTTRTSGDSVEGVPDPLRIVFLTDFHVHTNLNLRYYQRAVEAALALDPDIVLLGGDLVSRRWHLPRAERALEALGGRPHVYAIRGNHDFWTRPRVAADILRRSGARLLTNEVVRVEVRGRAIALVGIEDPYIGLTPRSERRLAEELAGLGDFPRVGLVHTPEAYPIAARLGCEVCVAGHTHGGQIRLPFFGTTVASSAMPREFTWGRGIHGRMVTFTSNGIGAFFPLRSLCPPQVVELRVGQSKAVSDAVVRL